MVLVWVDARANGLLCRTNIRNDEGECNFGNLMLRVVKKRLELEVVFGSKR